MIVSAPLGIAGRHLFTTPADFASAISLESPMSRSYTLCVDFRTETQTACKEDRRAIREDTTAAKLPLRDFLTVNDDGSGRGWDMWSRDPVPATNYPPGTFRAELTRAR